MMSSDWQWTITNRATNEFVCNAPLLVDKFSDGLGFGGFTLEGALATGGSRSVEETLLPLRRVIWPMWRGTPQGCYLVTSLGQYSPGQGEQPFVAKRIDEAIFDDRRIWSTLVFRQQDQFTIVRALYGYGLGLAVLPGLDPYFAQPGVFKALPSYPGVGDSAYVPWMVLDSAMSGILRDRTDTDDGYKWQRDLRISDVVADLSEVRDRSDGSDENGPGGDRQAAGYAGAFDYRLDYYRTDPGWSGDSGLRVMVRLGYPYLGTRDRIPLQYPSGDGRGGLKNWTFASDGTEVLTMARAFGTGQGSERVASEPVVDTVGIADGLPLMMGSYSGTASEVDTLAAQAASHLAGYAGMNDGWTYEFPAKLLGSYEVGDIFTPIVKDPARWPSVQTSAVRLMGHTIHPSGAGEAGFVVPEVIEWAA